VVARAGRAEREGDPVRPDAGAGGEVRGGRFYPASSLRKGGGPKATNFNWLREDGATSFGHNPGLIFFAGAWVMVPALKAGRTG